LIIEKRTTGNAIRAESPQEIYALASFAEASAMNAESPQEIYALASFAEASAMVVERFYPFNDTI
jgi:hypothetical protein